MDRKAPEDAAEPMDGDSYTPHNIADTEAQGGYTRRSKRERAAAAVSVKESC